MTSRTRRKSAAWKPDCLRPGQTGGVDVSFLGSPPPITRYRRPACGVRAQLQLGTAGTFASPHCRRSEWHYSVCGKSYETADIHSRFIIIRIMII